MKKYISLILLIFAFVGCSTKSNFNKSIVKTSEPIFITASPKDKKVYINFTNSSSLDSNLTQALSDKLSQNGYVVTPKKEQASTLVYANLNYFRKIQLTEPRSSIGFGMGRRFWGIGYGWGFDDGYRNSYIYDAQLSLKISIHDGKKLNDYMTNLNYQNNEGYKTAKSLNSDFNEQISNQILRYLKEHQYYVFKWIFCLFWCYIFKFLFGWQKCKRDIQSC